MARKEQNRYALCIGINDYPGSGSDLNGCVNDANDWAAELKARGFAVTMLLNGKATTAGITAGIKATIAKAVSGDLVTITYSGHGSFVPDTDGDESDGNDECLVPHDYRKGLLTDDTLFTLYSARAHGVKLLVISDSCHSGTVAKFAPITTPPTVPGKGAPQRRVRFMPPATFLKGRPLARLGSMHNFRRSSAPGRYAGLLISGCQDTEYSYDAWFNGRPNGAFTFVALRELRKLKKGATYRQWFDAMRAALPTQQYPQSPNLYGTRNMKKWKVFE